MPWSVRDQARLHALNGHAPYADTADAIRHQPETATAVATRSRSGRVELLAPNGPADLLGLVVRPTPAFAHQPDEVTRQVREKGWMRRWPTSASPWPERPRHRDGDRAATPPSDERARE